MKRIFYIMMVSVAAAALILGCKKEEIEPVRTPVIDITNRALEPNTDESGTVRAYIGTQVTAAGFNLDQVTAVKVDGAEASIVEKSIGKLVFEIPALDFAQQDNPYNVMLEVYGADSSVPVFKYPYFVTIPVTDALVTGFEPKAGTTGDFVTISGRNLDRITKVTFNGLEVGNASFDTENSTPDAIKVPVPAVEFTETVTETAISAVWAGGGH